MGKRKVLLKGLACAAIVAACVLLALTVGDGEYRATFIGWAPLLVTLSLIGLAYGYVAVAKRTLSFSESSSFAQCARGEKMPFSLVFENHGPLVLIDVRAELFVADLAGDDVQTRTVSLTLGPRRSCEVPLSIPFEHIGLFSAGLKKVVITDFLGLFAKTIENHRQSSIAVLPRVPQLGSMDFSDDSDRENFKMLKTALADSLDYAYVRDYEPGDPLKTIHWKLSARTDHYLTRLFEKSISPGVTVLVDFSVPKGDTEEAMELRDTVVESALAVADFARSLGLDTEIRYLNRFNEKRSLGSWDGDATLGLVQDMPRVLEDDGMEERVRGYLMETAASNESQSNLIVCSAQVSEAMVGAVSAARRMRKTPFFLAAVPRRLVDRDLERYQAPLVALEGYGIGYQTVSLSDELEGRDVA